MSFIDPNKRPFKRLHRPPGAAAPGPRGEGRVGESQQPRKSRFSDFETYAIESGVVDLVAQYKLGVKFMNFEHFFSKNVNFLSLR